MSNEAADFVQFWFALSATVIGMISVYLVHRNENRRRLRARFREIIDRRAEAEADYMQRKLAAIIADAIRSKDFFPLEQVTLVPYIEGYLTDIDFKIKLYRFLLQTLIEYNVSLSKNDLEKILDVINIWKQQDSGIREDVLTYLETEARREPEVRPVKEFIQSRKGFFGKTVDEFVDDVKEVVEVASSKSGRRTLAGVD